MPPEVVYKIVSETEWRAAEPSGHFSGSLADIRDGFIHLSTAGQLPGTLARHFAGHADLLLVAVATASLRLRWEPSRDRELFPHLYSSLPIVAVRWVKPLPLGDDGGHILPSFED